MSAPNPDADQLKRIVASLQKEEGVDKTHHYFSAKYEGFAGVDFSTLFNKPILDADLTQAEFAKDAADKQEAEKAEDEQLMMNVIVEGNEEKQFSQQAREFRHDKYIHAWIADAVENRDKPYELKDLQKTEKILQAASKIEGATFTKHEGYCIGNRCFLTKEARDNYLVGHPLCEIMSAKARMVNDELHGEAATEKAVNEALDRINNKLEAFVKDHPDKKGDPLFQKLDMDSVGKRSAAELNAQADWLNQHAGDYTNRASLKVAAFVHLKELDKANNYVDPTLDERIKKAQEAVAQIIATAPLGIVSPQAIASITALTPSKDITKQSDAAKNPDANPLQTANNPPITPPQLSKLNISPDNAQVLTAAH